MDTHMNVSNLWKEVSLKWLVKYVIEKVVTLPDVLITLPKNLCTTVLPVVKGFLKEKNILIIVTENKIGRASCRERV